NNNYVNNNNNILIFNENLIVRNGSANWNIGQHIDLETRRIDSFRSHSPSTRNTARSRPVKSHSSKEEGGNNCSLKNQGQPSTLPDFRCVKNFDNSTDPMAKEEVRELCYNQMYHENYKPSSLDDIYRRNNNNEEDSGVDSTPIDFKRNFAAIDSASKRGPPIAGVMESPTSPPPHEKHYFSDGDARVDDVVFNTQGVTFPSYWSVERTSSKMTRTFRNGEELLSGGGGERLFFNCQLFSLVRSPDSHDSGIHVEFNEACVNDKNKPEIENVEDDLPPGWERCEDPDGHFYYWDVKSGTVQRNKPSSHIEVRDLCSRFPRSLSTGESSESTATSTSTSRSPKRKPTTLKTTLEEECQLNVEIGPSRSKRNSNDYKDSLTLPIRFAVRSLGWTEVNEEDLKQDRSSRAVNKAIIDLSTGRKDLIDNVSKWGDGKELILELDDRDLTLVDPDTGATLHTQQIYQIRVWGVGRDNGSRDFAYVARDRSSRRYMCHVFRCDTPARTIANTLRDICKRLMLERRPTHFPQPPTSSPGRRRLSEKQERSTTASSLFYHHGSKNGVPRSTSDSHAFQNGFDSFPTPIEEPKKTVRCQFLGITQVSKATGIEVLNDAVDRLVHQVKKERWISCDVSISPSTITITEVNGDQLAECRVRYLSFLGIGHDIKHCAFIMQSSLNSFMCYVFYVEPSAGAMAKTVEAACKLRYQKVLDAHGERRSSHKGWTDAIRDMFGSFTSRKTNNSRPFSLYPR
uniref:Amyloid beta A4 protein-binding family B member 2 n=1 Tax=Romanomermis culicivorax TaxID=13658 RepID=A0A915KF34_ROMCU